MKTGQSALFVGEVVVTVVIVTLCLRRQYKSHELVEPQTATWRVLLIIMCGGFALVLPTLFAFGS